MNLNCPKCQSSEYVKNGTYYRRSDRRWIKKFKCSTCFSHFSKASFELPFNQKKRQLNHLIYKYLASNLSQRRIAIILGINRKTVARKLKFLGLKARLNHQKSFENQEKVESFLFDDLETIEHTKCKPVSVTIAVESSTRKILGLEISKMPAKGHLSKISRKKYGYREDQRQAGIRRLLEKLNPICVESCLIKTDMHKYYPDAIREKFPKSTHQYFKSARSSIAGQGELKKIRFDPIFDINHTLAMFRANVNRLIRKTWCTTKKLDCLYDHLWVYVQFHNEVLVK